MNLLGSSSPPDRTLVIERICDAPRTLVFKAWVEPERIKRWRGPRGFITTACEVDLRPGGAWSVEKLTPAGAIERAGGIFREIVEPVRLVFTHVWLEASWLDAAGLRDHETLVTVTLAEHDGGRQAHMTFRQEVFAAVEDRDSHNWGWNSAFDLLAEELATARTAPL